MCGIQWSVLFAFLIDTTKDPATHWYEKMTRLETGNFTPICIIAHETELHQKRILRTNNTTYNGVVQPPYEADALKRRLRWKREAYRPPCTGNYPDCQSPHSSFTRLTIPMSYVTNDVRTPCGRVFPPSDYLITISPVQQTFFYRKLNQNEKTHNQNYRNIQSLCLDGCSSFICTQSWSVRHGK